jgi:hypothetical protein
MSEPGDCPQHGEKQVKIVTTTLVRLSGNKSGQVSTAVMYCPKCELEPLDSEQVLGTSSGILNKTQENT